MNPIRQYLLLTRMHLMMLRRFIVFLPLFQVPMAIGTILGMSYLLPSVSDTQALYLTTGTVTNMFVALGLVALPQILAMSRDDGRLEYFLTLPVSREAYLASQLTYVTIVGAPGVVFALVLGSWHYGISLDFPPTAVLAVMLTLLSLTGVGVAVAMYAPGMQVTQAFTQVVMFYVPLFTPLMIPESQLPSGLQAFGKFLPTTYAADAIRGAFTELPGAHLERSLTMLAGYTVLSLGMGAVALRKRG